jgi:hypothetical protein
MGFSAVANFELETKQTRIRSMLHRGGARLMWSGCDAFT